MTGDGTRSPADDLRARLDEPQVAASLNSLLDHADLLAIVVVALDGFLARGDVIADSLASAIGEITASTASADLSKVDVRSLARTANSLAESGPALTELLGPLSEPHTVAALGTLAGALGDAQRSARTAPPAGALSLLRALRDPDVSRGVGFLLEVARALGRRTT
ncbi:DUF1641 domain-containing protein [Pseudonocardia sp. KRD-169]|uniref:DUF1641 domain-containing protein n=1 Tax=Pseudonocardia abyssalis TaxID=2792008 RepID=A0ABS6UUZ6_9PSEU|nr:DUF1641 domain-containing protein [Pseudonocardia abyssalis]MBW0136088.1 DUF1641 domain-containing protein [Pseudonocardia abyssalis]